jgi:mono/diheme cytochrome c family protein
MTIFIRRLGRTILLFSAAFFFAIFVNSYTTAETPADQKNPFAGDAAAIAAGKAIFEAACTGYCHTTATSTRVGRCPNLFDCEWKHGGTDGEIFHTMHDGVPNTEMVGFKGRLPNEILWKITAYIRSASLCKDAQPPAAAH